MIATNHVWHDPPAQLRVCAGEVHVWRLSLQQPAALVADLLQTLTPDERTRAERFRFEKHRRQFIVSRGLLRLLLGTYVGLHPAEIRFGYNRYGKPELADSHARDVQFNLSHSGEGTLVAITTERTVGVDLEQLAPKTNLTELAERFFAPREVEMLRAVPHSHRERAFYNCWTRKEAFIKACGEGFNRPLDQFVVSVHPEEPAGLLEVEGSAQEAARWCFRDLHPWDSYVGCVAVAGHGWELHCWDADILL